MASPRTSFPDPAPQPPPPPGPPRNEPEPEGARSVSFAPSGTPHPGNPEQAPPWGAEGHGLIAVGPGRAGRGLRAGLVSLYPFPITGAKIHPPVLRSDTLSRPRLTDWLDRAAAGRLGRIVEGAGIGKRT